MVAVATGPKNAPPPAEPKQENAPATSASPAPTPHFRLLSVEASGLDTGSGVSRNNFAPLPPQSPAPGNGALADRFFGVQSTPNTVPEEALAKAREKRDESLRRIEENPKLSPEVKERAKSDPSIRAFLGDEKVPIEMLEQSRTDPQLHRFLFGNPSPINTSYTGPVSQVRINAPPVSVSNPLIETKVPEGIRTDSPPKRGAGYDAIVENQRNLLSTDPNKVLERQHDTRVEHAPELKFNEALRKGVPVGEALDTKEKQEREGTSAFRMAKSDRQPGDFVGLYDRALHAQAIAAAIDRGAFKDRELKDNVVVPVRFEDERQIRESIGRSLRFLNAGKELLAQTQTGDLGMLQSQERRLVLERLSERSGKPPVELLKN